MFGELLSFAVYGAVFIGIMMSAYYSYKCYTLLSQLLHNQNINNTKSSQDDEEEEEQP